MIAVVVVNYQQTRATLDCLASLYAHAGVAFHLFLVDNCADADSVASLQRFAFARKNVTLITNWDNRGFAGACNQAFEAILGDERFAAVALLNNDTLVQPDWLAQLVRHLSPGQAVEMVAGKMVRADAPKEIDNLGIAFYRSGIASNRVRVDDPLLGPCGGAALYSTRLLRRLRDETGCVFDPDFFCYAEDTDLALRSRALGYDCAFAPDALVQHRISLSSGGADNEFVAYYGLRNSLFALMKNLPASFFWRNAAWLVVMQAAVIFKYFVKGKTRLIWRVYRDVGRGLPRVLRQRRSLQAHPDWRASSWRKFTAPRFYDHGYMIRTLRTLLRRNVRPAHFGEGSPGMGESHVGHRGA